MPFKLVKTGKSYGEPDKAFPAVSDKPSCFIKFKLKLTPSTAPISGEDKVTSALFPATSGVVKAQDDKAFCQIKDWAGSDPGRWKKLRDRLLLIYKPSWERTDNRDLLVQWVGACTAQTAAQHALQRFDNQGHLTWQENNSKNARQADVSFWNRLSISLSVEIPSALANDTEAAEALLAVVKLTKQEIFTNNDE